MDKLSAFSSEAFNFKGLITQNEFPSANHVHDLILNRLENVDASLSEAAFYHFETPGKMLRAKMAIQSASLAEIDTSISLLWAAAVEVLHNASLIHDDIVDDSNIRRNFLTINALWKNKISVLVGDFFLSKALLLSTENKDYDLLNEVSTAVKEISEGELFQIQKSKNFNLSEEDYILLISKKTASLFSAATKTGSCISGSNEKEKKALESYGRNLGLAFQIADDALDYYAKEKFFGKAIGKDFFEGKVTLPLITIFQKANEEEKEFLTEIMKKEKRTEEDFSEVLALINKYKAVETSLKKAEYFVNVSYDSLAIFPDIVPLEIKPINSPNAS